MSDIKIKVNKGGEVHELLAPTDMGLTLMNLLLSNNLIEAKCNGCGQCSSCHIYVDSDIELKSIDMIEDMMLDDVSERKESSRLSCQLFIYPTFDGLEITIPNNE